MFLRRPREVAEGSLSKTLQAGDASAQSMYCDGEMHTLWRLPFKKPVPVVSQ